jgi:hypothetical protein
VRFITIGVIDKDKFYKLNEKGELELLWNYYYIAQRRK